ncbi:hypothetical protein C4D60_Mb01t10600 [Musa balbisiana]|uniref:Uncharacterized protein n=1 Tax=Musa balbisiana TaxID=52838 RepID=A0A4S8JM46_MUSBA|nr:hypothetical protein C4D60_Mb01t10600 [Musa balbisiana]
MELLGAEEEAPQGAGPPGELAAFLQPRSVSTGLGLSLDDRRVTSSSGEWTLIILPTIDEDIDRELRRIDADIDWFIKYKRYKTLGAEVGTNDQDIRLQDHKNMEVCGTTMKPGVTSRMQKNLCVISVMWNQSLDVHLWALPAPMHCQFTQIKLKGCDQPTAYGFCQKDYLSKLKEKSNIIQLILTMRVVVTVKSQGNYLYRIGIVQILVHQTICTGFTETFMCNEQRPLDI